MLSTLTQTLLDSLPAARVDVIGLAHEEQHTYWITLTQVERGAAVRRIFDPVHSDECNLVALDQEPERVRSLNHLEVVASLQPCGQHRTTFPLVLPQGATHWGVVEVRSPSALDEQARFTTGALLQLYGNMLEMLDYSERDALTGLWNRKPFDDLFYKALAQPADPELAPGERRNSVGQFWLAMVDIDHFKLVNDRFGHLIGDEVLLLVARILNQSFRAHDRVYRFGGEEFVVVLRARDHDSALATLERFRVNMEHFDFPQAGRITASVGMTQILPGDSPTEACERADQAVYYAKHHGRNQVCSESDLVQRGLLSGTLKTGDVELF